MKKCFAVMLAMCVMGAVLGCGQTEPQEEPVQQNENTTGTTAELGQGQANSGIESLGLENMIVDYSAAVSTVLAKAWTVEGTEEYYSFEYDGNGYKTDASGVETAFEYACGFDKDKNILLLITEKESDREEKYAMRPDETGYRLIMTDLATKEEKIFTPDDLVILEAADHQDILGTWKDDNGNEYEFTEQNEFHILNKEDSDGTYRVVEMKEDNIRKISIFVAGGTLQCEYKVLDEGDTLELYSRDAETYYYWHR